MRYSIEHIQKHPAGISSGEVFLCQNGKGGLLAFRSRWCGLVRCGRGLVRRGQSLVRSRGGFGGYFRGRFSGRRFCRGRRRILVAPDEQSRRSERGQDVERFHFENSSREVAMCRSWLDKNRASTGVF
jgi:hypothetical protein